MKRGRIIFIASIICSLIFIVSCTNNHVDKGKEDITDNKKMEEEKLNQENNIEKEIENQDTHQANKDDAEKKADGYVFPDSHKEKLTVDELIGMPYETLGFARNEIFARRGHIFKNEKYRSYFSEKSWYNPVSTVEMENLNDIEKYNVNFIKFFEDRYDNFHDDYRTDENQYEAYPSNEEVYADIDGDGNSEKILFELKDSNYILHIDDLYIEGDPGNYCEKFALVDINKEDKYKEIIISDYGPSDDYVSDYYCFDGKKITAMGETQGLFDYGIKIDGSGRILARTRGRILQTWFFNKLYRLSEEHKLVEEPQELYETNYDVFVIHSIKLLKDKSDNDNYFILNEGQRAVIVGTDNKEWCLIEASNGERGWFAVENYEIIRNEGLPAYKVFAGLCYAD